MSSTTPTQRSWFAVTQVNSEQHFIYFFDTMLAHSFFPKITFPTRVDNSSGATLIDNVFCKLSSLTLQTGAGILLDEISDHYPYFVSFNVCHTPIKPPRLVKKRLNNDKAIQVMLNDMNQYDISRKMTNDLSSNPNVNYETLHDHIAKMKDKHLPYKFEKFHKHTHKNNKWISFGIIKSIKTRDAMYLKSKCCSKKMSNTIHWIIIIICKSNTKRKVLDKIIVDSKVIQDKEEICGKFDEFFANIGPN